MKTVNFRVVMMLLGVVAFTTLFSACSDDKNDDKKPVIEEKTSIIGKWALWKEVTGTNVEQHEHYCKTNKDYEEFSKDEKWKFIEYGAQCGIYTNTKGEWKLLDGKLIVIEEDYKTIFEIKKLNEKELILIPIEKIYFGYEDKTKIEGVSRYFKRIK